MVKRREARLSVADIENFAKQADKVGSELLDHKAPRAYKSIAIPFNEYEFNRLEFACEKTGRSKNGLIRYLILQCAKEIEENGG
jgi:hypothetical protein